MRGHCLNMLLSVVAPELPLCWPRHTMNACCNRGAYARISGDITKARELYELAQSGGIEDAKERIKKLQQQLVRRSPTQGR